MTDETKSMKSKYDFPCKTKINANSYCRKKRRKSFCKIEVKWEKKSSWTKEGKTVTMYKDWAWFVQNTKKAVQEPENQFLIILSIN